MNKLSQKVPDDVVTCALAAGLVNNLVHNVTGALIILLAEDDGGDLHQEALQLRPVVKRREDVRERSDNSLKYIGTDGNTQSQCDLGLESSDNCTWIRRPSRAPPVSLTCSTL